jgi:hypothetical protein
MCWPHRTKANYWPAAARCAAFGHRAGHPRAEPRESHRPAQPAGRAHRTRLRLPGAPGPQRRVVQRDQAEVGGGQPILQVPGQRDGRGRAVHRERQLVGVPRGRRRYAAGGQHGGQPVPGHLELGPVPLGRRPARRGQVRAGHAVPIAGRVHRGQHGLQRAAGDRVGWPTHDVPRCIRSSAAWLASDAEMLASN